MTEDKPLHVRVAEALGWWQIKQDGGCILLPGAEPEWYGRPLGDFIINSRHPIPRYDGDWRATGPLIQFHRLNVFCGSDGVWEATAPEHQQATSGPTPLVAVCHLILALHEAGRLEIQ